MAEHDEPKTKRELMEILQDERQLFDDVVARLTDNQLLEPGIEGNRCVKDILAHITDWEQRMTLWIQESVAGLTPQRPAPGMNWDDLDRLNEQTYQENKERPLVEVLSASVNSYAQSLRVVHALSEEDLFDGRRFAWRSGDPLWHMVAANTFWHYKEHRQQIESWLEARA